MATTDSKGTYFNQGNRGFATILQRAEQGSFFDSALRVAGRKQAAKQKEQDAILENLKPDDVWAPYSAAANGILEQGIEALASGNLDRAGAMKIAVQYKNAQSQAKGMQEAHKTAIANYDKDSRVDAAKATEWRWKSITGDGTLDYLNTIVNTGVDDAGFLNEWGGGSVLNDSAVVKDVVKNLRTTLQEFSEGEQKEYMGPGSVAITRQKVKQLTNELFTRVPDPDNANQYTIALKDVETLRREGLLDTFLEDEYFNRVVQDALWNESGQQRTNFRPDEIEGKAMELLNMYGAAKQEITTDQDSQGYRYSTGDRDSGKGDDVDAQERMAEWYRHLKSNDPQLIENAANHLANTIMVPGNDLVQILSEEDKKALSANQDKLSATDFKIIRASVDGSGELTMVVEPSKDSGSFLYPGKNYKAGRPMTVKVNRNASDAPEFWNKYYNLAMKRSMTEDKPHYNENKGGDVGSVLRPPTPQPPGRNEEVVPDTTTNNPYMNLPKN